MLLLVAIRLVVSLGIVDRGLEMGDEGYFLLNLNQAEAALPALEIYRFLAVLRGGAETGVVEARVLRIAAEAAGSLALIAGVFAWARRRLFPDPAPRALAFAAICLQGVLITAASRSLGYNDMTNLFFYGAVGCLFGVASAPSGPARRRTLCALGAGALTAFQLTAKFPPAVPLFAIGCVVLGFVVRPLSLRARAGLFAGYLGAFTAALVLVVAATGGPRAMGERLAITAQLPALTGYDPVALLLRYVALDVWTELHLAVFWTVFGVVWIGWRRRPGDGARALLAGFLAAAAATLVTVLRWHPAFMHWSLVSLAVVVVGLAVALLVAGGLRGPAARPAASPAERMTLLLVLLLIPISAIAGTNVPLTLRLPTHVLPLFVLVAVLLFERGAGAARLRAAAATVLALLTTLVFVQHHLLRPYGLRETIFAQRSPLEALPGVRVDLATRSFLERIASAFTEAGFRRGDPVIALDYMPGLVHFLGGSSPRYNLYMFDMTAFNCFNLNHARFERPPFLILGQPMTPEQQACIESIRFPDDYELVQTVRNPYQAVYEGFGRPGFSHVFVYAPRGVQGGR